MKYLVLFLLLTGCMRDTHEEPLNLEMCTDCKGIEVCVEYMDGETTYYIENKESRLDEVKAVCNVR